MAATQWECDRMRPMAKRRSREVCSGPCPVRMRQRSSSKAVSYDLTLEVASLEIIHGPTPRSRRPGQFTTRPISATEPFGTRLVDHVGFPTPEVLGPAATEDEIRGLIDRHGSIFVKPFFRGGVGKKGRAGLIGEARDLAAAIASSKTRRTTHVPVALLATGSGRAALRWPAACPIVASLPRPGRAHRSLRTWP